MKTNRPTASVIVPMLNAERHIAQALTSVFNQTEVSIEVIVVNDKSTDGSARIIASLRDSRLRMVEGPGRGISACLNAGLATARGSVLMRCDADDIYPPGRIKQQIDWLEANPNFDAVCGSFSTLDQKGKPLTDMLCGDHALEITDELRNGIIRTTLCSFAIKASIVEKLGGFREYFEVGEDIDFQLRLGEMGRVGYVPYNWYAYRIHSFSKTHTQKSNEREFFEATAHRLQQQRRDSGTDDLENGSFPIPPREIESAPSTARKHIQSLLLGHSWRLQKGGNRRLAIMSCVRAVAADPTSGSAWKSLIALLIKS